MMIIGLNINMIKIKSRCNGFKLLLPLIIPFETIIFPIRIILGCYAYKRIYQVGYE